MNTLSLTPFLAAIATAVLVSCGDDPELVAKREKQKAEINRLNGELALVQEKLKNLPPDVSADLEKAKKQSEEQTAEIAGLEKEIAELQGRKRALQTEFDEYRAKYQTK
jgi:peptidoglycan hydrolase CwlO-like protein